MDRQFALITRLRIRPGQGAAVIARLKAAPTKLADEHFFTREDEVLSVAFAADANLILEAMTSPQNKSREARVADFLIGDWNRQIIQHVSDAKLGRPFRESQSLQLRYIEVPPAVHSEYLNWREHTIFAHVREQEQIDSFQAYHSLISTEPGVLFLSAFSCPEQEYVQCFNNPHYHAIVREAGEKFIVNGATGLYTKIYQRI